MQRAKVVVQSYNAQLAVDGHAQIIVEAEVTQQVDDKQQLAPMAKAAQQALGALPEAVLANAGYWMYEQLDEVARAGMQALVSRHAVYRPGKSRPLSASRPHSALVTEPYLCIFLPNTKLLPKRTQQIFLFPVLSDRLGYCHRIFQGGSG
jgi:hypothetical protein